MVSLSWNFERCLETFPFSVNNSSWYISLLALLKCMKNELTLFTISICVSSCDDVSCIVIDKIYQINTDCRSVSKNIHAVYLNCYLLEGYWSDKCCYPLWIYMAPRSFTKYKIENSYCWKYWFWFHVFIIFIYQWKYITKEDTWITRDSVILFFRF